MIQYYLSSLAISSPQITRVLVLSFYLRGVPSQAQPGFPVVLLDSNNIATPLLHRSLFC